MRFFVKLCVITAFSLVFGALTVNPVGGNSALAEQVPEPLPNQVKWPAAFKFAAELQNLVYKFNGQNGVGPFSDFGSIVPNLTDGSVDVYWAAEPPAELLAFEELHKGALRVTNHRVSDSWAVLAKAQDELMKLGASPGSEFPDVSYVAIRPDASGLEVGISKSPEATSISLDARIETAIGVDVSLEYAPDIVATSGSRQSDTSPYSGGAFIQLNSQLCSSGFGVQNNATGLKYILTAYHCIAQQPSPISVRAFASQAIIGTWNNSASLNQQNLDAALYRPTGGISTNTIYIGPQSSSLKTGIYGVGANLVGYTVCTSGANSSTHCSAVTQSLRVSFTLKRADGTVLYTVSNAVQGMATVAGTGIAEGDSGGPVYADDPNFPGSSPYKALGIISAGSTPEPCASGLAYSAGVPGCFKNVIWVDAAAIMTALNLGIAP